MKRHHLAAIPSLIITSIHIGAQECVHTCTFLGNREGVWWDNLLSLQWLSWVDISYRMTSYFSCLSPTRTPIIYVKRERGTERVWDESLTGWETSWHTSQTHCMTVSSEKNNQDCVPPETRISTCFHQRPRRDKGDVISWRKIHECWWDRHHISCSISMKGRAAESTRTLAYMNVPSHPGQKRTFMKSSTFILHIAFSNKYFFSNPSHNMGSFPLNNTRNSNTKSYLERSQAVGQQGDIWKRTETGC